MRASVNTTALLIVWAGLSAQPALAAATDWVGDAHASVRLITATNTVGNQSTLEAGLQFRFGDGWHGYWRKPGDAGVAPVIAWSGSAKVAPDAVLWPAPTRLVIEGLRNNVYSGDVVLPTSVTLRDPGAPADLKVSIDYAACGEICVPFHADLALALPAGPAKPALEAGLIDEFRAAVPKTPDAVGIAVLSTAVGGPTATPTLTIALRSRGAPFVRPDLFVEGAGFADPGEPTVTLANAGQDARLQVTLPEPLPPDAALTFTIVDGERSSEFRYAPAGASATGWAGLAGIMLTALLGGLILNLMPCVLPVLSIKLLSVVRHAGMGRRATRAGLSATALGIVASFLAIGVTLVAVKLSGATVGWGIQFQQPWFLGAMATLTTLFASSLFEWLPIHLPGALGSASGSGGHGPLVEAFLTGAFATLLATPCSAPFVGTAVGFALAQGPREIFAVFTMLGLGMALPYLLVAASPGLVRWMPRPGAWMLRLRQGLGLLLIGTAAWLLFVLATVTGFKSAVAVAVVLMVLLITLAWTHRADPFMARASSKLATGTLAAVALALAVLVPAAATSSRLDDGWSAFDAEAVPGLLTQGKTVLVDVSASWCLTCKVNDLAAFDRPAVQDRLARPDVVRMRADWSRPDPTIAAFLKRYGRYGIPLDVVFTAAHPDGEALPELLTPAIVLEALGTAPLEAGKQANAAPAK